MISVRILFQGRFYLILGECNPERVALRIEEATDRFKDVASALGTSRDKLSLWISDLNKKMGIETSLAGLGSEFKKLIPQIAYEASVSSLATVNPRKANPSEIQQMLEKAFGASI